VRTEDIYDLYYEEEVYKGVYGFVKFMILVKKIVCKLWRALEYWK
jgi:hypothetical protein